MDATVVPGLRRSGNELFTLNADPGHRVYGEDLRPSDGKEFRRWDPWRSKLAALVLKRSPELLLPAPRTLLYLGASHGTTVSHLSDLFPETPIYAVEKSPTSFAPLLHLARRRKNLLPMLVDAQLPERYAADVGEADFIYQDVAQRAQAEIFLENCRACLAHRGRGILMLKVRSVTQARAPRAVLAEARAILERGGLKVTDTVELAPFSRDHIAVRVSA